MAVLIMGLIFQAVVYANVRVVALKGDVSVRHGVHEEWLSVAKGDVLKPDDSIRLGKGASATILTDENNRLTLPEMVIIDLADLRNLTQEELMLTLAMERVRSLPDRQRDNDFTIPHTTTTHGAEKEIVASSVQSQEENGNLAINGVKVLYNNGYYATCVLRAKQIFRIVPETAKRIDARLLVASALEKIDLREEALSEYTDLSNENLSQPDKDRVEKKISELKKHQ